jgi:hypothetical protein
MTNSFPLPIGRSGVFVLEQKPQAIGLEARFGLVGQKYKK